MSILTLTALIALAITMIILLAPLRVRFRVADERQYAGLKYLGFGIRVENPDLRWVLTFFGWQLLSGSLTVPTGKKPTAQEKKSAKPRRPIAFGDLWRLLSRHSPTLRRTIYLVLRLVGRLLRAWRLEEGQVTLVFGAGDPGGTGMLAGYFYAMQGWLARLRPSLDLRIHPDFDRRTLRLTGAMTLRIIPITPIWYTVQTLGTIPWRGLWKLKRAWAAQ